MYPANALHIALEFRVQSLSILKDGAPNDMYSKVCLIICEGNTVVMWGVGLPIYAAAVFIGGWSFTFLYALMFLEDALKFLPVHFRINKRKWMKNLTHGH